MIEGMYEHEMDPEGNYVHKARDITQPLNEVDLHGEIAKMVERLNEAEQSLKRAKASNDTQAQIMRELDRRIRQIESDMEFKVDARGREF